MPSILIETGFLTNRSEERYLAIESGQNETAKSILDAVLRYKSKMENSVNGMFNEQDRTLTGNDSTKENSLLTKPVVGTDTIKNQGGYAIDDYK